MPFAEISGKRIHYREAGSGGEAVVLVHALPMHSGMWAGQMERLSGHYRVIAPDAPGFGQSAPPAEGLSIEQLAQDLAALLGRLGIGRAVFAGLSMGGYVLFDLWRRTPGLFRALVLCDTRANADPLEVAAGREKFAKTALEKGLAFVADDMTPKLLRHSPDPEVASRVRQEILTGATPAGVAAMQRALARRPDSVPTLVTLRCPTLVVVGEEDGLCPPSVAEAMADAIPAAQLARIPGAGHLSNLENPQAFNQALLGFLAGLPA